MILDALLLSLGDLAFGLVALFLLAVVIGTGKWVKASRLHEEARVRPEPVEPNGFDEVLRPRKHNRGQEVMGERRRVA